jgi:hypothetical protein
MSITSDIREVEVTLEEAKEAISMKAALKRLSDNKDFQKLIIKGLFAEEAERVVGAKADTAMIMNEVGMVMLDNIITTIGGLRQYFLKIQSQGSMAEQALGEHQDTHTELLREEMEASEVQ